MVKICTSGYCIHILWWIFMGLGQKNIGLGAHTTQTTSWGAMMDHVIQQGHIQHCVIPSSPCFLLSLDLRTGNARSVVYQTRVSYPKESSKAKSEETQKEAAQIAAQITFKVTFLDPDWWGMGTDIPKESSKTKSKEMQKAAVQIAAQIGFKIILCFRSWLIGFAILGYASCAIKDPTILAHWHSISTLFCFLSPSVPHFKLFFCPLKTVWP